VRFNCLRGLLITRPPRLVRFLPLEIVLRFVGLILKRQARIQLTAFFLSFLFLSHLIECYQIRKVIHCAVLCTWRQCVSYRSDVLLIAPLFDVCYIFIKIRDLFRSLKNHRREWTDVAVARISCWHAGRYLWPILSLAWSRPVVKTYSPQLKG